MKKLITLFLTLFTMQQVNATCSPSFTFAPAPHELELLRVEFTNTSTGGTSSDAHYRFYYEDGGEDGVDSGGTVYHTFASPGSYRVILNMQDSISGGICEAYDTMYVTVAYPECATTFTATLVSATFTGATFSFTPSTPSGAIMTSYLWDFGDGSTSTEIAPTYTYLSSGSYTITLTTGNGVCSYTFSSHLDAYLIDCDIASVTAVTIPGSATNTVNFSTTSTPPYPSYVADYSWDFGDGTYTTDAYGSHVYPSTGTYTGTVTLHWRSDSTSSVYVCSSIDTFTVEINNNYITGSIYFLGEPTLDTSLWSTEIKVWLIKYNPSTSAIFAIDSITMPITGSFVYNYHFYGAIADSYRVKAAYLYGPITAVDSSSTFIPTYGDSSILWNEANVFYHNGVDVTNKNIYMRHGTSVSGPGFISGDVTAGAGKATSSGAPEAGMLLVLFDASNNPVKQTYTDADGLFQFSNLPVGTYRLHAESMNYRSYDYATIVITSSSPSVTGRNFVKYNTARTIIPVPAGLTDVNGANDASIYPNPAQDLININFNGVATVNITDIAGRQVVSTTIDGKAAINVSNLQSGHYIFTIKGDAINMTKMIEIAR